MSLSLFFKKIYRKFISDLTGNADDELLENSIIAAKFIALKKVVPSGQSIPQDFEASIIFSAKIGGIVQVKSSKDDSEYKMFFSKDCDPHHVVFPVCQLSLLRIEFYPDNQSEPQSFNSAALSEIKTMTKSWEKPEIGDDSILEILLEAATLKGALNV